MITLTDQTCGEACWHAREETCHCSCGGRNHGCLKTEDGVQPTRTAKIAGVRYELAGVGDPALYRKAARLNHWSVVGFSGLNPLTDHVGKVYLYYYTWKDTEGGAPALVKYASQDQRAKWPELAAWKDAPRYASVMLLWKRVDYAELVAQAATRHVELTTTYKCAAEYKALIERLAGNESDQRVMNEISIEQAMKVLAGQR